MPVLDVERLILNRVDEIQEYHKSSGIVRAQLDVSGGVDSAVMLGLLAKAVGPENITAVYSNIDSSADSEVRAQETADAFGVRLAILDLGVEFDNLVENAVYGAMSLTFKSGQEYHKHVEARKSISERMEADPTILGSFRSCIRAPIGRFMNRLMGNGIRHGTGNECEDRWLRFYQKGGDGEVDTNPLAMLSKGEVYQLAVGLGVPMSVLTATPSPDLQGVGEGGHNDEDELKTLTGLDWTYSKVDPITGEYTSVGTIERMSRMADCFNAVEMHGYDGRYGDQQDPFFSSFTDFVVNTTSEYEFGTHTKYEISEFIRSAKEIEVSTRHKVNPNCPTFGGRSTLIYYDIITDELPTI